MKLDQQAILNELRHFVQPAALISATTEAKADATISAQWQRFIEEQQQGSRASLLSTWSHLAAELPNVQNFLRTMLKNLLILREQNGTLSLLYLYTVGTGDLNFFRGHAPLVQVPERLLPIWGRIPAKLRDFYVHLHNGWTFLPANSMGPLPVEDWAFLADDQFDIDQETARKLPIDINKTVAVFHNGGGDYLCLNCAERDGADPSGIIWWHEDPANPEPVEFWSVLDAWLGVFLEEVGQNP